VTFVFNIGTWDSCRRMLSLYIVTITRSGTCEYWMVTWDFRLTLRSGWQLCFSGLSHSM